MPEAAPRARFPVLGRCPRLLDGACVVGRVEYRKYHRDRERLRRGAEELRVQIGIERRNFCIGQLLRQIDVRPEALARTVARRLRTDDRRLIFWRNRHRKDEEMLAYHDLNAKLAE